MLSGPSIGAWDSWALFGIFSASETMLLPSSAATWSSQLIVNAFPSGKAAESLRGVLSTKHSKGTPPYSQSLALLNTEASLLNFTECFDPLHAEATLGCRLLDSFPDHISFHSYNCSSLNDHNTYLESLDHLYLKASLSSSTLVVVTDANVIPSRHMQAVSAVHLWNLGQQVPSSKAPASRTTVPDAELFAIRLGIAKATSMAIERIILITDSLGSAR